MRMYAPKRFCLKLGSFTGFSDYPVMGGVQCVVPLTLTADDVDVKAWFWDTEGRDINDCVHSKLVGAFGDKTKYLQVESETGRAVPSGEYQNGQYYQLWWTVSEYHPAFRGYVDTLYCATLGSRTSGVPGRYTANHINGTSFTVMKCGGKLVTGRYDRIYAFSSMVTCNVSRKGVVVKTGSSGFPFPRDTYLGADPLPTGTFWTVDDCRQAIWASMMSWAKTVAGYFGYPDARDRNVSTWASDGVRWPKVTRSNFVFSEPEAIQGSVPIPALLNPNGYWKNWLVQHAYLEACQSVPTLNDNSISNVIEIVGFIKALVVDHRIEIPKSLQSAWLSYRYVYKTTELDAKEAIKFVSRYRSLGGLNRSLKCYGSASTTLDLHVGKENEEHITVVCRCTMDIMPREMGTLSKIWNALQTYGLSPDFYVIWDMIPYSFIVDWFIPVGDMLSVLDAESVYCGDRYDISNVCFSLTYEREIDGYCYKQYSRWRSSPLKSFNEFYWFDKPETSSKVKLFRLFDSASLFIK